MGVYMEPIYDELIKAWNEGVWTYDQATKKNFRMYVWYQYSMHDFLAFMPDLLMCGPSCRVS